MNTVLAVSSQAWQELMDAVSDRLSWFLHNGIWMIVGVVLGGALVAFTLYCVMRRHYRSREGGGNLW